MFIYMPEGCDKERVLWKGGESTQLHYQQMRGGQWKDINVQTLMDFPTSMKDMHLAMRNFYDDCFALSMEFLATL